MTVDHSVVKPLIDATVEELQTCARYIGLADNVEQLHLVFNEGLSSQEINQVLTILTDLGYDRLETNGDFTRPLKRQSDAS